MKFHVAVVQKTAKKGNRERRNARTDLLLFVIFFSRFRCRRDHYSE